MSRKAGFKGGSHSYGASPGSSGSRVSSLDSDTEGPYNLSRRNGGACRPCTGPATHQELFYFCKPFIQAEKGESLGECLGRMEMLLGWYSIPRGAEMVENSCPVIVSLCGGRGERALCNPFQKGTDSIRRAASS